MLHIKFNSVSKVAYEYLIMNGLLVTNDRPTTSSVASEVLTSELYMVQLNCNQRL